MSWTELTLGQLCTLRAGMVFKPDEQGAVSGDLPFIKVSDMNSSENEIAIRAAKNWVQHEFVERARAKPFPAGTIVFAKIGEALKQNRVRRLTRPTLIDNNMMGAIPNQHLITPEFLYYRLSAFDIAGTATGTALPYLTVSVLEQQRFSIPSLHEQRRIASILSAYDGLIENNTRRIAILEEMARRIYDEWFVSFRFPGHENVRMVQSGLRPLPEGWQLLPVSSVGRLLSGFAFKSSAFVDDGIFGVVTIKNVQDGLFIEESSSRLSEIPSKMPQHCRLAIGDILLSLTGNVGRCCLVTTDRCLLNQRVAKVQPNVETDWPYVYLLFRSAQFQERLVALASGVAQQNLSPVESQKLLNVVPPSALRLKFSRQAADMLHLQITLRRKNSNLRATRDLLLHKLISGDLDVSTLAEVEATAA